MNGRVNLITPCTKEMTKAYNISAICVNLEVAYDWKEGVIKIPLTAINDG